jgi:hypothetical protein
MPVSVSELNFKKGLFVCEVIQGTQVDLRFYRLNEKGAVKADRQQKKIMFSGSFELTKGKYAFHAKPTPPDCKGIKPDTKQDLLERLLKKALRRQVTLALDSGVDDALDSLEAVKEADSFDDEDRGEELELSEDEWAALISDSQLLEALTPEAIQSLPETLRGDLLLSTAAVELFEDESDGPSGVSDVDPLEDFSDDFSDDDFEDFPDEVPGGFVRLQKARLGWVNARKNAATQLNEFADKMTGLFPNERPLIDKLKNTLADYDGQLLDKLDDALSASGAERDRHHEAASAKITEYLRTINEDEVVRHIDSYPSGEMQLGKTLKVAILAIQSALAE